MKFEMNLTSIVLFQPVNHFYLSTYFYGFLLLPSPLYM